MSTDSQTSDSHSQTQGGGSDFARLSGVFSDPDVPERLRRASPGIFRAAQRYWHAALSATALSSRMKELVLVALHGTATSLHSEGIRRHLARALAAGATEQDVLDVLMTIVGISNHALYSAVPLLVRELEAAGEAEGPPPMSAEVQAIKDDFIRACGFWNDQRDVIARMMPDYFAALSQVSTAPWLNGSLSEKERELICIAIDCTVTHMYEPGLIIHIRHALQKGATREEILAVFHLAALTGLEGYVLGAQTLFGKSD